MNTNVQKWVAALRSGEYKQTKNELRNEEGFCCLGVACDVYAKENGHETNWEITSAYLFDGFQMSLPNKVREYFGLYCYKGSLDKSAYPPGTKFVSLTQLNDNENFSLAQIADFIESNPEGLFIE